MKEDPTIVHAYCDACSRVFPREQPTRRMQVVLCPRCSGHHVDEDSRHRLVERFLSRGRV